MSDILLKVGYLMALTFAIGFIIAFIIKLIVVIINLSGNLQKYDRNYMKEIQRARNIKNIRIKRLYRDTIGSNELINSRYGNIDSEKFKLKNTNNSNEIIEHYYGK
jgi:hypothetical protein